MGCYEDESATSYPIKLRVGIALFHSGAQRVNARIAGDPNPGGRFAFIEQIPPARLCGCKIPLRDAVHGLTIELLGPRAMHIMGAQARLHVTHGYLQVKAGKSRCEAGCGVAMHKYDIGLLPFQHTFYPKQHVTCHVEQRLSWFHDGEVIIRHDIEGPQNLVEHLTMLARHGHHRLKLVSSRLQLVREWAHLNGLRTRAEDEHDLLPHRRDPTACIYCRHGP